MKATNEKVENRAARENGMTAVVQDHVSSLYKTHTRTFASILPFAGDAYRHVFQDVDPDAVAYFGAVSPDYPHVTIIRPWDTNVRGCFFGSTLGHYQHDPSESPNELLEVYEVLSGYAAMLIDSPGESTMALYPLRPGDKVGTPNHCIMTIFSLGDRPATLWDIANPARHQAHKEIQQESGPSLVLSLECDNLVATIPRSYLAREDGFGVKGHRETDSIVLPVADNRPETVYTRILSNRGREEFEHRGIRIVVPDDRRLAHQIGIPANALSESIRLLRKDQAGHPLRDYLFRGLEEESRHVAIVGGYGDLATNRFIPAMSSKGHRFDVVENRRHPANEQHHAAP